MDSVAQRSKVYENAAGQLVTENTALKAENSKVIADLTDSIFKLKIKDATMLKSKQSYTRINQEINVKDKTADYIPDEKEENKPIAAAPGIDTTNLMRVPQRFLYTDTSVTFAGTVKKSGVTMDSISIKNTTHLREVTKKKGFLNLGRETTVQAINSNPAVINTGISTIRVQARPNWWNRWGKPVAAAVLAGIAVDQLKK